jgi:hypothetical protein
MSELPQLTAGDVTPEWIAMVRKTMADAGLPPARAHPKANRIELKTVGDHQWRSLMIETSRFDFTTPADRDIVLRSLNA